MRRQAQEMRQEGEVEGKLGRGLNVSLSRKKGLGRLFLRSSKSNPGWQKEGHL